MTTSHIKRWGSGAALLASGLVVGGVLAGTLSASAAGSDDTTGTTGRQHGPLNPGDPTKSQRADETLLTGATATKVRAAVLAKYPGATIHRLESDSDGVYEAHLVTKDGTMLTAEVDKAFKVTGTESHGPGRHGGPPPMDSSAPAA